jgi:orotidine-5'-phosphate decarboxylase
LFKNVIRKVASWGSELNTMFVVGATHPGDFTEIREIVPEHFLLVPGVGAQGGTMNDVITYGKGKKNPGLFVNSSRSILYSSKGEDCLVRAREEAIKLNKEFISVYKN